ncbi:MAG: DUF6049 family protein [Microbacterium sp.]|uniref:DUF6049 family protein n=1 Tax=Microbacterium sp. TaxID=51671 RepID=UPI003F9E89F6
MITPRTGNRVRAPRGTRGFVVFSLAASLIFAPQLSAVPAAVADTADVEEEGTIELSMTSGAHGVVQPDSSLTTSVTIDNATGDDLGAGRVTIALNNTPLADSAALAEWLDSDVAPGTFTSLTTTASDAVTASETVTMSVFTPSETLGKLADGVYPIRAQLAGAMTGNDAPTPQNITTNSVLVVDSDTTAQVSVVVPITATPAGGALLTADELTELTGPDGALTAQLDGVAGTPAALAVDPLIPAAIRVLGTAAPVSATEWLTRLETLPNERFALQDGDADATVQAQAGFAELLAPLSLASFMDEANFAETENSPTPSPSPSPTPTGPVLPTDAELTKVSSAIPRILWPVGDVNTADLVAFNTYFDADVTTILPSTSLPAYTAAHADVDGHDVLLADAAASEALSAAAGEEDAASREANIVEGVAHLSLTRPQASLLVGLDRNETRPADALRATVMSLSTIGSPVGLEALRSTEPASGTLIGTDPEAAAARAATLSDLLSDETRLTAFASILDDPLLLRSPERLQLLRVIAVGTAETFEADAAAHRSATTTTMNAVGVQEPSPIQLFTSAAPLPVWVRNDLPWPVNVKLTATPSDARLDVEPMSDVVALPASNTRVKVPVSARVGSGTLSVNFSLNSPTGVQIGVDQTASVTVRAEWENIGLGILGGLIVLLLGLGIVRTVVRRKKDRAVAESESSSESDAGGESDAAAEEVTGE